MSWNQAFNQPYPGAMQFLQAGGLVPQRQPNFMGGVGAIGPAIGLSPMAYGIPFPGYPSLAEQQKVGVSPAESGAWRQVYEAQMRDRMAVASNPHVPTPSWCPLGSKVIYKDGKRWCHDEKSGGWICGEASGQCVDTQSTRPAPGRLVARARARLRNPVRCTFDQARCPDGWEHVGRAEDPKHKGDCWTQHKGDWISVPAYCEGSGPGARPLTTAPAPGRRLRRRTNDGSCAGESPWMPTQGYGTGQYGSQYGPNQNPDERRQHRMARSQMRRMTNTVPMVTVSNPSSRYRAKSTPMTPRDCCRYSKSKGGPFICECFSDLDGSCDRCPAGPVRNSMTRLGNPCYCVAGFVHPQYGWVCTQQHCHTPGGGSPDLKDSWLGVGEHGPAGRPSTPSLTAPGMSRAHKCSDDTTSSAGCIKCCTERYGSSEGFHNVCNKDCLAVFSAKPKSESPTRAARVRNGCYHAGKLNHPGRAVVACRMQNGSTAKAPGRLLTRAMARLRAEPTGSRPRGLCGPGEHLCMKKSPIGGKSNFCCCDQSGSCVGGKIVLANPGPVENCPGGVICGWNNDGSPICAKSVSDCGMLTGKKSAASSKRPGRLVERARARLRNPDDNGNAIPAAPFCDAAACQSHACGPCDWNDYAVGGRVRTVLEAVAQSEVDVERAMASANLDLRRMLLPPVAPFADPSIAIMSKPGGPMPLNPMSTAMWQGCPVGLPSVAQPSANTQLIGGIP